MDSSMHATEQRTQRGRCVQASTQQHRRHPVKRCLTCRRSTKSMMANGSGRGYYLKPHRTSVAASSVFGAPIQGETSRPWLGIYTAVHRFSAQGEA
jgi:hypothetical protein